MPSCMPRGPQNDEPAKGGHIDEPTYGIRGHRRTGTLYRSGCWPSGCAPAGRRAPPPPGMHMGGPGPWGPGKVEERLTKLHEALNLSPDQAAAWEAFATQAKERAAQARADRPDPQTWAKRPAPDRSTRLRPR